MIVEEDLIADIMPQEHEYIIEDIGPMYQMVDDSSIRGKNKVYSNLGFSYTVKTRNGKKLSSIIMCVSVCVCVCVSVCVCVCVCVSMHVLVCVR